MNHSPGPFIAEGGAVKAISHGIWYTVALVDKKRFTPNGRAENAAFLAHASTCHDELLEALKALASTARTFRSVPKAEQEWTNIDDEALSNAFDMIAKAEKGA